jgi:hypothetical protein
MRFNSLLTIGGLCLLWLGLLWIPTPDAIAAHCRTVAGKQVCIAWIKRSAKRYWEYQAVLAIDGTNQPKAVYRERSKSMRLSDLSAPKPLKIKP